MPVPAGGYIEDDELGELFTLAEFVSYLQMPEFDEMTARLARELATSEIRLEVGGDVYDAMSPADRAAFKSIALAVAKRTVTNPSGLRSSSIDDYSETYASESLANAYLTAEEKSRIGRILGRGTAFTIRPYGRADTRRRYL